MFTDVKIPQFYPILTPHPCDTKYHSIFNMNRSTLLSQVFFVFFLVVFQYNECIKGGKGLVSKKSPIHQPSASHRFVRRGSATLIQRSASSWPRRSSDSAWMLVPRASWGPWLPYVDLGDEFWWAKMPFR